MLCINIDKSVCCICYDITQKFNYCNDCPTQICSHCRSKIIICPVCRSLLDNNKLSNKDKIYKSLKYLFIICFFFMSGRYISYIIKNNGKYFININMFILTSIYGIFILSIFIILIFLIVITIWILFVKFFGLFPNNNYE